MKVSQNRQAKLYAAIKDPIMDFRVKMVNSELGGTTIGKHIDAEMFAMEQNIWRRVHSVLNLEGPV